jgi:hypothetical protein
MQREAFGCVHLCPSAVTEYARYSISPYRIFAIGVVLKGQYEEAENVQAKVVSG